MEIFLMALCFLNGAVLASCFFIAKEKTIPQISPEKERTSDLMRQWDNFLNYDGTARGQKDYENKD